MRSQLVFVLIINSIRHRTPLHNVQYILVLWPIMRRISTLTFIRSATGLFALLTLKVIIVKARESEREREKIERDIEE